LKQPTHTIPSREEILGVFRDAGTPLDAATLARALKVKPAAQEVLGRRLNAMQRDGQINAGDDGIYSLADSGGFIAGRIAAHRDGFGFVIPEEPGPDLFLNDKEMQKVLHGDRVLAKVVGTDRRGRPEGTIVEVVERANTHIIGRLLNEGGVWIVAPEDQRMNQDVLVAGGPGKAKAGQVVSVELIEQPARFQQPTGRIVEVLGELDDPGMEIEIAVRKFGVPHVFSPNALKQANKLPNEVRDPDLMDRVDLRDVPLVTIDGEDARDFDDAVYCEPVKLGRERGYRLLVAIADVSHYVKPNDSLDADAIERSTSVYFPRRVIPMLPEKLSNGLCSLNPAVDRLTLVCDMVVTAKGEVTAYQFYPAVIHSAARLTYNQVAAVLADPKGEEAQARPAIVPHLLNLNEVFHALLGARQERGAIDFETTETYIVCNPMGKIEKIIPRTRNDAHRLIEECMLAANVCAADLLIRHKHPGTFRIHAVPTEEKLNQLRTFLKQTGLNLGGGNKPSASDYAAVMREIKERPDAALLQTMLLRSMQQAVYSPDNVGHFGLAYEAYAHFTSPIRRYPDLLTHRAIKAILLGKRYEPKGLDVSKLNTTVSNATRKQAAKDKAEGKAKNEKDLTIWDALGVHCSANERRADEASRDVENWLKCYFMQDKLGESFTGTVAGVTTFGIFVQLDELYVEGLVHVTGLGQDYFQYDEARHLLRGERTGKTFGLTDRVTVQVAKVDLEARKIDLVLADGASVSEAPAQARQPAHADEGKRNAKSDIARDAKPVQANGNGSRLQFDDMFEAKPAGKGKRSRRARKEAAELARQQANGVRAPEPQADTEAETAPVESTGKSKNKRSRSARRRAAAERQAASAQAATMQPVNMQPVNAQPSNAQPVQDAQVYKVEAPQQPEALAQPAAKPARKAKAKPVPVEAAVPAVAPAPVEAVAPAEAPAKPARKRKPAVASAPAEQVEAVRAPVAPAAPQPVEAPVAAAPKRTRTAKAVKAVLETPVPALPAETVAEAAPVAAKRTRRTKAADVAAQAAEASPDASPSASPGASPGVAEAIASVEAPAKPRRTRAVKAAVAVEPAAAPAAEPEAKPAAKRAAKPAAKAAAKPVAQPVAQPVATPKSAAAKSSAKKKPAAEADTVSKTSKKRSKA
jgi:ribonuclease R